MRLRNSGRSFEVNEASDASTYDAVATAKVLLAQGAHFHGATVDRFDGLVLVSFDGNWHFTSALCGYQGNGPMTTAEILEMFGFGTKESIFANISTGDSQATFSFAK